MENIENKKKYRTSNAVKKRFNDKTYKSYNVRFRFDDDSDVIFLIESEKQRCHCGNRQAFKNLIIRGGFII